MIFRERPTGNSRGIMEDLPNMETEGALLGLPETQTELDVNILLLKLQMRKFFCVNV